MAVLIRSGVKFSRIFSLTFIIFVDAYSKRGGRGRDRIVVGFTNYAISAYHH
jgi:hypothetical protein